MMNKEQIIKYLLDKVEEQVIKVQISLDDVIEALDNRDWKTTSEHHRQVDYWLSRIKNTQRLIDEAEEL